MQDPVYSATWKKQKTNSPLLSLSSDTAGAVAARFSPTSRLFVRLVLISPFHPPPPHPSVRPEASTRYLCISRKQQSGGIWCFVCVCLCLFQSFHLFYAFLFHNSASQADPGQSSPVRGVWLLKKKKKPVAVVSGVSRGPSAASAAAATVSCPRPSVSQKRAACILFLALAE